MKRVANTIFTLRIPLLLLLTLVTIFLTYHVSRLQVATDFSKMVPQNHEYIQTFKPFRELFGGGNQIKVSVSRTSGPILNSAFLKKFQQIYEDVMFIKGIDRRSLRSIVSPQTRVIIITEEGFNLGHVVPSVIPETEEGLAKIGENITLGGLKGLLVSMDMKSALITAEIYETGVDYVSVYRELNTIRTKYSDNDLSIHINGFAMVVGFVNDALPKILGLFVLSAFITFLILWRAFRLVRLALLPLSSGGLAVLWSLGIAQLIGMRLDPMTTVVPFLVFSIGVSHGIQMIKRYLEECAVYPEGYDAALNALTGLMKPGTLAVATNVLGFLTILFIPIGAIRDLATTASIGIACIIVANLIVLTLVLSFFGNLLPSEAGVAMKSVPYVKRILARISKLSYGRNAYTVAAVSFILLLIGFFSSRTMNIGDVNPGEPLLWEDSVYNRDAAKMMTDYMLGIDWLSVVVAGDNPGICKEYDILQGMREFELEIGGVPGVTVVISALLLAKVINETFHEGDIRWRDLPKTPGELAWVMSSAGSTDDTAFMNMGCQHMHLLVYLTDHKGNTVRRVLERSKEFIARHPMSGARFVLAGGNAGVMGATNEMVGNAQVPMMLLIYLSISVLCLLVFRNLKAPFFIVSPLLLVSVIATAFMKAVGLGLNVNTLPVSALGVGIGVDYGIYFYSRLMEERKSCACFSDAVRATLETTGAAVLYTALTLTVGVLTWLLSDLKFQADMGILLSFIYVANMIGAMVLLPALVYIFDVKDKTVSGG